jgi:hypothetical protein
MKEHDQFDVIFVRMKKMDSEDAASTEIKSETAALEQELDEIEELRRIILEINDPEPACYTSS